MALFAPVEAKKSRRLIYTVLGIIVTVVIWWIAAEALSRQIPVIDDSVSATTTDTMAVKGFRKVYPVLPRPDHVLKSYPELLSEDHLISNALHSIWLNVQGYFWALVIALPLGFLLGLIPVVRMMFSGQVDALRFLPLTALAGLFMTWFGLGDSMKVAFLAFGILVYLLPVVVQRISEVDSVYLKTVYTLGANDRQILQSVYLPAVFTKLVDDIRVLTAISWTYIIIAELLNRGKGIGSLVYIKGRLGQIDKVFAILLVIILIGLLQDKIFSLLDRRLFPHKYYAQKPPGLRESKLGIFALFLAIAIGVIGQMLPAGASSIFAQAAWIVAVSGVAFIIFGEFKIWRTKQ